MTQDAVDFEVGAARAALRRSEGPTVAEGRRGAVLGLLCLVQFVNSADVTVLNVALPVLREELGFAPASLSWVINGYLVAMTASLLVAGRLCDTWGVRRVFVAGLSLFAVSATCCAAATGPGPLVLARIGQGFGAALATAAELAIVVVLFHDSGRRARALALMAVAGIVGSSVGLVGGGAVVEWLSWRWVFSVDVVVGVLGIVLALRWMPADRPPTGRSRIGVGSAALAAAALTSLAAAVVAVDGSWPPPVSVAVLGLGGAVLLAAFVATQRRSSDAFLPWSVLTDRTVMVGGAVLAVSTACLLGQFYVQTQYLQLVLGYDSWSTGLAFLPVNVGVGLISLLVAGRLVGAVGARAVLVCGMLILAAGLALYAVQPASGADYVRDVLPAMILVGLAGGVCTVAATVAALESVKDGVGGVTGGLVKVMQQGGGVVGVAVMASATVVVGGADVTAHGLRGAFVVAAVLALVGALGTLLLPRRHGRPVGADKQSAAVLPRAFGKSK